MRIRRLEKQLSQCPYCGCDPQVHYRKDEGLTIECTNKTNCISMPFVYEGKIKPGFINRTITLWNLFCFVRLYYREGRK